MPVLYDLLLHAGMAYDTTPVDATDRTADTPIDRQVRVFASAEYQTKDNMKLRRALTYADYGSGKTSSPTLDGEYDENRLLFITVGLEMTF